LQNKLQLVAAFNTSPNGARGALWQGGGRIAADTAGNLYFETGNGTFDTTLNPTTHRPLHGDYGDTFLKIAADPTTNPTHQNINGWGLKVVDYFTPFNQAFLDGQDLDIGSTAPILLPDSVGLPGHPLLFGGGKEGRIYLVDRSQMGGFDPTHDHIPEEKLFANFSTWGSPAYFNNQIYVVGSDFPGWTFSISGGKFSTSPKSQSHDSFGYPGSTPYISANGTQNGIVWDLEITTGSPIGELRAYDARSYATELYTSDQAPNGRDRLGTVSTFSLPTVAHGKVYVGTYDAKLVGYGLLKHVTPTEAVLSAGAGSMLSHASVADAIALALTDIPLTAGQPIDKAEASTLPEEPATLTHLRQAQASGSAAPARNTEKTPAAATNLRLVRILKSDAEDVHVFDFVN
jgi:hypothetical protein